MNMGVRAIKIEGRQRSPAYVAQVTKVWREAIDSCREQPAPLLGQARLDERSGQGRRRAAAHAGCLPPALEVTLQAETLRVRPLCEANVL
jgi:collagenase-like PrtC family protease